MPKPLRQLSTDQLIRLSQAIDRELDNRENQYDFEERKRKIKEQPKRKMKESFIS
jgi:hypothetical protein